MPDSDPTLCGLIAERSMQREDEEKVSFIWDSNVVFAYLDPERKNHRVLSYHDSETLKEINTWLAGIFRRFEELEEFEEEDEEERDYEDGDEEVPPPSRD